MLLLGRGPVLEKGWEPVFSPWKGGLWWAALPLGILDRGVLSSLPDGTWLSRVSFAVLGFAGLSM